MNHSKRTFEQQQFDKIVSDIENNSFSKTSIYISYANLNDKDIEKLNNALRRNKKVAESLKEIKLMCNDFTIPPDVSNCKNLMKLNLSSNKLKNPPDVRNCLELRGIYLAYNDLKSFPDLKNNINLEELYASNNYFNYFPDLSKNVSLKEIYLDSNKVEFKNSLDLTECINLERIWLGENNLVFTPDFSKCKKLEFINLRNNKLIESPNLSNCYDLSYLNLSINNLTEFPDISNNDKINYLNIGYNFVTFIPESSLSKLKNIKDLYINENKLTSFPNISGDLRYREDWWIQENEFTNLGKETIRRFKIQSQSSIENMYVLRYTGKEIDLNPDNIREHFFKVYDLFCKFNEKKLLQETCKMHKNINLSSTAFDKLPDEVKLHLVALFASNELQNHLVRELKNILSYYDPVKESNKFNLIFTESKNIFKKLKQEYYNKMIFLLKKNSEFKNQDKNALQTNKNYKSKDKNFKRKRVYKNKNIEKNNSNKRKKYI